MTSNTSLLSVENIWCSTPHALENKRQKLAWQYPLIGNGKWFYFSILSCWVWLASTKSQTKWNMRRFWKTQTMNDKFGGFRFSMLIIVFKPHHRSNIDTSYIGVWIDYIFYWKVVNRVSDVKSCTHFVLCSALLHVPVAIRTTSPGGWAPEHSESAGESKETTHGSFCPDSDNYRSPYFQKGGGQPLWRIRRGTRVPLQGAVVLPLLGAIVLGRRVATNLDVVPLQGAIVVSYGGRGRWRRGGWRPTLGWWTSYLFSFLDSKQLTGNQNSWFGSNRFSCSFLVDVFRFRQPVKPSLLNISNGIGGNKAW